MTNQATTANPCMLAQRLAAMIYFCDVESQADMDLTLLQIHQLCQLKRETGDREEQELSKAIIFKFDNGDEPETAEDYMSWISAIAIMLPVVLVRKA